MHMFVHVLRYLNNLSRAAQQFLENTNFFKKIFLPSKRTAAYNLAYRTKEKRKVSKMLFKV